jgi:hypothetical protein
MGSHADTMAARVVADKRRRFVEGVWEENGNFLFVERNSSNIYT